MAKLLRVLVIFFLLLSIGALVLAVLLFNKREILTGRTRQLEDAILALGPTIEQEKAPEVENDFPARDVSKVEAQVLETPEVSEFWKKYQKNLEEQNQKTLDLKERRLDLQQYYKIDPGTLKPERDALTKIKKTTGQGTMHDVLQDLQNKATDQLGRLNATRQQLLVTRDELVSTIEELNKHKGDLRQKLVDINNLNEAIARLEQTVREKETQISELEDAKKRLEQQVTDLQNEIERQKEELAERDQYITTQRKRIAELTDLVEKYRAQLDRGTGTGTGSSDMNAVRVKLDPGRKGVVVEVNPEWRFVVVQLEQEFLNKVTEQLQRAKIHDPGDARTQVERLAPIELYLKRGPSGVFVAKIRLTQVKMSEKIGIADVLTDWEKLVPQKGDQVYY